LDRETAIELCTHSVPPREFKLSYVISNHMSYFKELESRNESKMMLCLAETSGNLTSVYLSLVSTLPASLSNSAGILRHLSSQRCTGECSNHGNFS
jgi:hypothetical protein